MSDRHRGALDPGGFEPASIYGNGLSIEVPDEALMAFCLDPDRALPAGPVHYAEPFGI